MGRNKLCTNIENHLSRILKIFDEIQFNLLFQRETYDDYSFPSRFYLTRGGTRKSRKKWE